MAKQSLAANILQGVREVKAWKKGRVDLVTRTVERSKANNARKIGKKAQRSA